jgi:hypothetical protein
VTLQIIAGVFAGVLIIFDDAAENRMRFQRITDEAFVMVVRRATRGRIVLGVL